MDKLLKICYTFEQVDFDPAHVKYDFVSLDEKEVPKRVSLIQYPQAGLENFYNLALSNISVNENGEEQESDMCKDNNKKDGEKVLATCLFCALDFLTQYKAATVVFQGNTVAKQRLYKMSINRNLTELSRICCIRGGYIRDLAIETDELTCEKRPISEIDLRKLQYENYTISESGKYHFISFQLRETE